MRIFLHLFLLAIVCGCSRNGPSPAPPGYTKHSGDFTPFFSETLMKFGGRTNGGTTTRFDAEWWFKSDTIGFQILMATNHRAGVESSLRETFGEPIVSAGYPHLLYRSGNVGVTVAAQTQLDPMHIIITRAGVLQDQRLPIGIAGKP